MMTRPEPPDRTVRAEAHLRAGSVAGLRALRHGVGECLSRGACRQETIADAQLVVAEIATNAFVHDTAPLVDVQVACLDDEVVISTWHRGDVPPPPHPVLAAPLTEPSVTPGGRGLAIVDRIVAARQVANSDGCTTTVVRLGR